MPKLEITTTHRIRWNLEDKPGEVSENSELSETKASVNEERENVLVWRIFEILNPWLIYPVSLIVVALLSL